MPGINTKGNTQKVQKTVPKKRLEFPELSTGNSNRIFTKHFTNLLGRLNEDSIALLGFLVYQSDENNVVKYTTKLLQQYARYTKYLSKGYNKNLKTSLPNARVHFKFLIEDGILLPAGGKKYLINPNLTYHEDVDSKYYNTWTKRYRFGEDINVLVKDYI